MIEDTGIRRILEQKEESLSRWAAKSRLSRGRFCPEPPCPVRTDFQRDRDRIIHSKAFRRLKHKTQVFIAPQGDHYVTRLTHTLEVSQIARTIARALSLNEDLTEAIALGHDVGHTPFGHMGEVVLNELFSEGFRHNEQSLRVVDVLEKNGKGLNLTFEVRDGILNHSKAREGILDGDRSDAITLEGQICKIADAIAYINHDIVDAVRAGIIEETDLPQQPVAILGATHSRRINTMVCDVIATSLPALRDDTVSPRIEMSAEILYAANRLRDFLFQEVYTVISGQQDTFTAKNVVRQLYEYLGTHTAMLPHEYARSADTPERQVVDYIAGMTDQYALRKACELGLLP